VRELVRGAEARVTTHETSASLLHRKTRPATTELSSRALAEPVPARAASLSGSLRTMSGLGAR